MATLEENLRKIRGEAIYGRDVREAIAEGITQMDDAIVSEMNTYKSNVNSAKSSAISSITSTADTAVSNMNTKVNQYAQRVDAYDVRMNTMQQDINNRDLFMKVTDIGSNDYRLTIMNAI